MIEYTVDEEKGIICSRFSQEVDLTEAKLYLQRSNNDPKCKASYGRLVIIDPGAMMVDANQGNHMRALWEKAAETQKNYVCAIVCDSTSEAMTRLLMQNSPIIDSSVQFFSSKSAAVSWLETKMSEQKNASDRL